jgi:hypothetical protein
MHLLVKFPTRSRPKRFFETLAEYIRLASNRHRIEWIISMDNDDQEMNNPETRDTFETMRKMGMDIQYFYGDNKTKVEAMNANMDKASDDWEVLFLAQDDMLPAVQDWDEKMLQLVTNHFEDLDGCIWPPDGYGNSQTTSTVVIMGRAWYKRFGYIYYPEYKSVYCDNEYTDVALSYDKIRKVPDILVEHKWVGVNQRDELCDKNESPAMYDHDRELFVRRTLAGFPISLSS